LDDRKKQTITLFSSFEPTMDAKSFPPLDSDRPEHRGDSSTRSRLRRLFLRGPPVLVFGSAYHVNSVGNASANKSDQKYNWLNFNQRMTSVPNILKQPVCYLTTH
jgi:hypothetical protein